MLYPLNLCSIICQLCLNKTEGGEDGLQDGGGEGAQTR